MKDVSKKHMADYKKMSAAELKKHMVGEKKLVKEKTAIKAKVCKK